MAPKSIRVPRPKVCGAYWRISPGHCPKHSLTYLPQKPPGAGTGHNTLHVWDPKDLAWF